jgi:HSF-type DNA-binding
MESNPSQQVDSEVNSSASTKPWSLAALSSLDTSKTDLLQYAIRHHHSMSFPSLVGVGTNGRNQQIRFRGNSHHLTLSSCFQLMLVLLHIDKEQISWIEANGVGGSRADPPVPPIEWCTRGTGGESDHVVVLYNVKRLVKELLPQFGFPTITTSSFIRKLCRWGFHQVSAAYGGVPKAHANRPITSQLYECQHFRRGNFALLNRMSSDTAAKRRHQESLMAANNSDSSNGGIHAQVSNHQGRPGASTGRKRGSAELEGEINPRREVPQPSRQNTSAYEYPHDATARSGSGNNSRLWIPPDMNQLVALSSAPLVHTRPGAPTFAAAGPTGRQPSAPLARQLLPAVRGGSIQPARINNLELLQILQGQRPSGATQHLSVASLAAASLLSAAQTGAIMPLQTSVPPSLMGSAHRDQRMVLPGTRLPVQPLVPVSALAVPQQQREVDPRSSNLTIREWISLLQRAQQPRPQHP